MKIEFVEHADHNLVTMPPRMVSNGSTKAYAASNLVVIID